jgi:low affinity Fe/Cu permease
MWYPTTYCQSFKKRRELVYRFSLKGGKMDKLVKLSEKLTNWIGTPTSIVFHTLVFIGIFSLKIFNFSVDQILLILTTAVSLEAIYLSIFIQMSVNKTKIKIAGVEKDIDDIQEDVQEISEDIEDINEDDADDEVIQTIKDIEQRIVKLHKEVVEIKETKGHLALKK